MSPIKCLFLRNLIQDDRHFIHITFLDSLDISIKISILILIIIAILYTFGLQYTNPIPILKNNKYFIQLLHTNKNDSFGVIC